MKLASRPEVYNLLRSESKFLKPLSIIILAVLILKKKKYIYIYIYTYILAVLYKQNYNPKEINNDLERI